MALELNIKKHFKNYTFHGIFVEAYTNEKGEIKKWPIQPVKDLYKETKHYMKLIYDKQTGRNIAPNAIQINTENISVIDIDIPDQCLILDQLLNDCKFIVKTNKGYHFYFNLCDKLLRNGQGNKGVMCGIADIDIDKLWFCPEYIHREDNRTFHYKVIKDEKKLSDMPDYAVMWCNMLINLKQNGSSEKTATVINKKKSKIEKIIIQPDFEVEKFDLITMKNIYDIYFKHGQFDSYDTWRNTAYMSRHLNNTEECFKLFDSYCRKVIIKDKDGNIKKDYSKEPELTNRKAFFGKNEYNINYDENGILIKCAKLDPELYNKTLIHLYKSKYEDELIKINSKYLYPDTNELNYIYNEWVGKSENSQLTPDYKCLMFKSAYGTGKTYGFKKIIENYNPEKVLFITYRQSLAHSLTNDLHSKFGFKSYLDKKNDIRRSKRVIIQLDSIHKLLNPFAFDLQNDTTPFFDLIVLDEMEGLLNHLSYNQIEQHTVFNILERLIKKSKKVLCLDGDLGDRSLDFINNLDISYKVYHNEFKPNKKHFIFTSDMEKFNNNIKADIEKNKKIVIVCMTKTESEKYKDLYKDEENAIQNIVGEYGKKYRIIIHNSIEKNKDILQDVNKNWAECDILIYSPSVESGVDFNIVNYFYKCYALLSNQSTSFRAFNQMLNRVRYYEDNNIMCYFNADLMEFSTIISPYRYDEMKLYKYSQIEDTSLINTLIHNDVESINSKNYFMPSLIKSILDKGHTYQHLNDKVKIKRADETPTDKIIKNIIESVNITDDEYNYLLEKQRQNEDITREETYQISKMYYYKVWKLNNIDLVDNSFLYLHYNKIDCLKNNKLLHIKEADRYEINKTEIFKKFKFNKIDMMIKIVKALGFNIDDKKISITQELFQTNKDKVIEILNSKEYKLLFNCGKGKVTKERFSLNGLLETYGLKVTSTLHRKQIDKKKVNTYTYKLDNLDIIDDYYKRVLGQQENNNIIDKAEIKKDDDAEIKQKKVNIDIDKMKRLDVIDNYYDQIIKQEKNNNIINDAEFNNENPLNNLLN